MQGSSGIPFKGDTAPVCQKMNKSWMKCGSHLQLNLGHTKKDISDLCCACVGTEDVRSSEKSPSQQLLITVIPLPQEVYLAIILREKLGCGLPEAEKR